MILPQTHSRLATQLLAMQDVRIFVAGDVVLDTYIEGKVSRLSPEAPVPVVHESTHRYVLGGAGNVAANVASFGAKATLCGRIGVDEEGAVVKRICTQQGVDVCALIEDDAVPTIRKTRVLAGYQQIVRIDREVISPISAANHEAILRAFQIFLAQGGDRCLVISDYGKGMLTPALLRSLIDASVQAGVPVVTDPKSLDLSRYAGSTVLKPNLKEGRDVYRTQHPGAVFSDFAAEIAAVSDCVLQAAHAEHVVMSLSEEGVAVRTRGESDVRRLASHALQVADVSGAGDTMIAFLAMGLACGQDVVRATELANIAAGVVCGKLGTATLSQSEFLAAFKESKEATAPEKAVDRSEIGSVAGRLREAGRRIVFTNGCFDILHAGHVTALQRARAQGDLLIVGLNSDESVRRLKGPTRPIQTAADRAAILAGLACVDFVVAFDEDTPLELIKAIRPGVLVKGGDYDPEASEGTKAYIVGAKEVKSWGGRVTVIPLLEGRSTTSIVARSRSAPST